MNGLALIALFHNAALLLAMIVLLDIVGSRQQFEESVARRAVLGVILGAVGIGIMLEPFPVAMTGVVFDSRSVLLSVCGLFIGFVPTVLAMAATSAYRVWLGGTGAGAGVSVVVATGTLGLLWRRYRRGELADISWLELYVFGVAAHVVMLALMLTLPTATARLVLSNVGLPVLLVFPVATTAVGLLMAGRLRRECTTAALAESENRYRSLFENNHAVMLIIDPDGGRIVDANPAACAFYGWTRDAIRGMHVGQINTLSTDRTQAEMERARAELCSRFEFRHRRADGSLRDVEVFSGPVVSGGRPLLYSIVHDVTERRQAEAARRETELRFTTFFDQSPVGLSLTAPDGTLPRVNPALCRLLGYSAEELAQLSFAAITHPDDVEASRDGFRSLLAGERDAWSTEKRHVTRDGRIVWTQVATTLARGAAGQPLYFLTHVFDISERKRAEAETRRLLSEVESSRKALLSLIEDQKRSQEALVRSERSYRVLFEANPHPMWVYDSETLRFMEVNDVAVDRYGYTRDEFLAMTIRDIRPAEDVPKLLDNVLDSTTEVRESGPWRHVKRNGEIILVQISSHSLNWLGRPGRLVAAHDVTARERARNELQASEERLRRAIDGSPFPILLHAEGGAILQVSQSWCEITGYPAHELATTADWVARAFGERQPLAQAEIERLYVLDRPVTERDYTIRTRSGEARTWEFSSAPLGRLPDGRRLVISMASDVTERRRAEAALSQLNVNLEQRVFERTAELAAANEELDSFAYAVSHDLRAPLRAMSGFSLAMIEDHGDQLPPGARGYLDQIRQASQAMGRLIDGLLGLSRSTRGDLQRDWVDLSSLAERLCQELARTEPERQVSWRVEPGLTVWGDARMLEVVMRNLLGNAWKYTTGSAAPQVRVHEERDGDRVFCCVADNGAGFDMRHADRLFKPFQRLHRQDEFPGVGIGLATVQRVINRHGGVLQASATVGQGASFRFHLPASEKAGDPA